MSERLSPLGERKFFADYTPEQFAQDERTILEAFFSNTERPVFVAKNLPPTVIGALIGRHSQSPDSMRRIFLDEYAGKNREGLLTWIEAQTKAGKAEEFLDSEKAESLLAKHFVGWGHDSLVATIPLVLGFERVSQLGAKGIEDTRIGLSPIERSTRYGFFGEKVRGKYLYARSPVIMNSPWAGLYEGSIDSALDLYVQLQEPVAQAYKQKFPDANERKIRQMTFDATRVLLVAANFTNLGAMVNGQALENMIIKLKASGLAEHQELGQMIEDEVGKIIPVLVERIKSEFGSKAIEYLTRRGQRVESLAKEYLSDINLTEVQKGPTLVSFDPEGENKVIAAILWPGCDLSEQQVLDAVSKLPEKDKLGIIERYLEQRPDRRSKPGRAFEEAALSFQLVCRFAEWRDLQRNRILTPRWRLLDYSHGIDIGEDLQEFGFGERVEERLQVLAETHSKIAQRYPDDAQYLVAFGALMPYLITLNFRELITLSELRTDPGAHKDYARHASDLAKLGMEAYPLLGRAFQFVNWR